MGFNREKKHQSSLISDATRENVNEYKNDRRKIRREIESNFFKKTLDYRHYVFSPEGYEGPIAVIYIALLPYIMGLLVLFIIAEASYEHFMEFDLASYLIIWAIGYEMCALLILIVIFLAWIKQGTNRWEREQVRKRPTRY